MASVWHFTLPELNSDDFASRQHATVSLSPYGSEHAHKLLSVSDWMPPTPNSGSDMGLRYTSSKTAADGEYSGSTSHCDTSETPLSDSCFSARVQLLCNQPRIREMTGRVDQQGVWQENLNHRCDVINIQSLLYH